MTIRVKRKCQVEGVSLFPGDILPKERWDSLNWRTRTILLKEHVVAEEIDPEEQTSNDSAAQTPTEKPSRKTKSKGASQ